MSSVAPLVIEEEEDRCRITLDDAADEDESWRQNAVDRERSIMVTKLMAWPNLIRKYVSVEGTLGCSLLIYAYVSSCSVSSCAVILDLLLEVGRHGHYFGLTTSCNVAIRKSFGINFSYQARTRTGTKER